MRTAAITALLLATALLVAHCWLEPAVSADTYSLDCQAVDSSGQPLLSVACDEALPTPTPWAADWFLLPHGRPQVKA